MIQLRSVDETYPWEDGRIQTKTRTLFWSLFCPELAESYRRELDHGDCARPQLILWSTNLAYDQCD